MGKEIERKFLVKHLDMLEGIEGAKITQGYLSKAPSVVRIRIKDNDAFLTVKGEFDGIVCSEYEYGIPVTDAQEMMSSIILDNLIIKTRYEIMHDGLTWEVDVFGGENEGLIMAEVELTDAKQEIHLPDWVGEEVSGDRRYSNAALAVDPFQSWK